MLKDEVSCMNSPSNLVWAAGSHDKGGVEIGMVLFYSGGEILVEPDDAIAFGKHLIELGEEVKRGV